MRGELDSARLLAVIETQNEIAAMALDADSVLEFVARRARELTRAAASLIETPEGDEMVYRVGTGTAAASMGARLRLHESLSGRCVLEGRVLRSDDTTADPRVDTDVATGIGARSMICVPLRHRAEVAGVLTVTAPEPEAFEDQDVVMLGLLSGVIAAHMTHSTAYAKAERASREDPMTGLANRRAFGEELRAAVRFSARKHRPVALCLLDVDEFKQINDRHGHPAGDAALSQIARVLAAGRAGDRAFRIGGDEFALIMLDTNLEGGLSAAGRIRSAVAARSLNGVRVSVSTGVATLNGETAEDLIARADAALYQAKAARRDDPHA